MTYSAEVIALFAVIFFVAAFAHGSIGFGFPMIATPLLALVTDIQTAIVLTLIPTLLVNLVSIKSEGHIIQAFRQHLPLALYAMSGSAIGTYILIGSDSQLFGILLSLAVFSYLLIEKINLKIRWVKTNPQFSKMVFGISAGLLGGFTNVMAPILIVYSLESDYSKKEIIQASNFCFLLGKLVQLVLFSLNDRFNQTELTSSLMMIIFVSLALYVGLKIKRRINADVYRNVLRWFLFILASSLLIRTIS